MSDLKRYRIVSDENWKDNYANKGLTCIAVDDGVLVPDDTLQQIADAWKRYEGDPSKMGELGKLLDGLVSDKPKMMQSVWPKEVGGDTHIVEVSDE